MCMFSGRVDGVGKTKIFARFMSSGRQCLIYSMSYSAPSEVAMILPLPVTSGSGEDAVRFVDLSGYPRLFSDLADGFPLSRSISIGPQPRSGSALEVQSVGSFDASFVPTMEDFVRLDRRFQLPSEVWHQLPTYLDYGFAVFKLKSGAAEVHPMAFEFPTRFADQLFFPTVHVHDGSVGSEAGFDHLLYCQADDDPLDWECSEFDALSRRGSAFGPDEPRPAREFVQIRKASGLLHPDLPVFRRRMQGLFENRDVLVTVEATSS